MSSVAQLPGPLECDKLILHDYLSSGNGWKVRLVLNQIGAKGWEYVQHDILKGETRTKDFLENINANGRIPVLEIRHKDQRETLSESNAIMQYLAEGTSLIPADRFSRAKCWQWMCFEQYSHEPYIAVARYWIKIKKSEPSEVSAWKAGNQSIIDRGYAALQVMDDWLVHNPFFAGETYSIADISLMAYTQVADEGDFDLSAYPNVVAWMDRVREQPGYVPITYHP